MRFALYASKRISSGVIRVLGFAPMRRNMNEHLEDMEIDIASCGARTWPNKYTTFVRNLESIHGEFEALTDDASGEEVSTMESVSFPVNNESDLYAHEINMKDRADFLPTFPIQISF